MLPESVWELGKQQPTDLVFNLLNTKSCGYKTLKDRANSEFYLCSIILGEKNT